MSIKVEVNNMVFDSTNPACKLILSDSQGKLYGFVECIDASSGQAKRYWGEYSHDDARASIKRIMEWGGKWPELPPGE